MAIGHRQGPVPFQERCRYKRESQSFRIVAFAARAGEIIAIRGERIDLSQKMMRNLKYVKNGHGYGMKDRRTSYVRGSRRKRAGLVGETSEYAVVSRETKRGKRKGRDSFWECNE